MNINELEVVQALNEAIPESLHGEGLEFEFSSNYYSSAILFSGIVLWSDSNDEREYGEDGEHEPLLPFIKRRFNALCDNMNKIRLVMPA